jgi:hypothetical protein
MSADISIDDLKRVMVRPDVSPRARSNDIKKAQAFLDDPSIKIVEKIDGTKLTLLRRNNAFDPNDYTKNWYVSYRGNVIYPGETRRLAGREEEVRAASSGVAQYYLIHSHLARVHANTSTIPPGTEFFLEFVQRKPTISREYPQKHGIFLTLFGPSRYKVTGAHLVTNMTPVNDESRLEEYARLLGVRTYPVLFEGSLATMQGLKSGIRSRSIERRAAILDSKLRSAYGDTSPERPLKIVNVIYDLFSDFDTSLSTENESSPAEGSVFRTSATQALYKALRFDQHDAEHREAIKQKFRAANQEDEQSYWNSIIAISSEIAAEHAPGKRRNVPETELNSTLERIHHECYFDAAISNRLGALNHPKSLIQRQEDLFLTTKSQVMRRLEIGSQNGISVGIFVVAGKPVHAGHWGMIALAAQECDEVLVITSTSGRDELPPGVMIDAWKTVLEPQFHRDYPNVTLVITSDSPLQLAVDKMRQLKNVVSKFVFYSDDDDARGKYSAEKMSNYIRDPIAFEKFQQRPVMRSETVQISGTRMRQFLAADDKESFDSYVPQTLSQEMKDTYWSILKGESGRIKDSYRRPSALAALFEAVKRSNHG